MSVALLSPCYPGVAQARAEDRPQPGRVTEAAASAVDDWTLVARATSEARFFGTLFERHRDYVFRLAWGFAGADLADDVTQEVFARVLQRRKPWLRQAKFTTVLYQITLNTARELRRSSTREVATQGEAIERLHREVGRVEEPRDLALNDLSAALAQLPERQREVVVLRHFEGMSTRETARILRCSEGTIKTHLHRGLAALRVALSSPSPERHRTPNNEESSK